MRSDVGSEAVGDAVSDARAADGWRARLALDIGIGDGGARTSVRHARHEGPLRIQRAFYPEGADGPCHVYVLHPPGGMVSGDALSLDVHVAERAACLLTTPGASKFYRGRSYARAAHGPSAATVSQTFRVADDAQLEWLPHETIVFDGAAASARTAVELTRRATYVGWDMLCLGRPAAGERFCRGELRTELTIAREQSLVFVERGHYRGGDSILDAPWGLRGFAVYGTLVVASPRAEARWVDEVREHVTVDAGLFAVTLVAGVLIARFLGPSTREGRLLFERTLSVLRPHYAGREHVRPRIWST